MSTTIGDIITSLEERLAALADSKLAEPSTELARWVVMAAHELPLAFDIDPKGNITNPRPTSIQRATRFNRRTAQSVARVTSNGKGEGAKAMYVRDTYMVVEEELTKTLTMLKQTYAKGE